MKKKMAAGLAVLLIGLSAHVQAATVMPEFSLRFPPEVTAPSIPKKLPGETIQVNVFAGDATDFNLDAVQFDITLPEGATWGGLATLGTSASGWFDLSGTLDDRTFRLSTAQFFATNALKDGFVMTGLDILLSNSIAPGLYEILLSNWDTSLSSDQVMLTNAQFEVVPIPGAVWLLGSGMVGLIGLRARKRE